MDIGPATRDDCDAIAALWNPIINDTTITFNSQPKTVEMLRELLEAKTRDDQPFLLARDGDALAGFATYGRFRGGNGYDRTVEHTIMLGAHARGRGLGRVLLTAIEDHARTRAIHTMVAGLSADNGAAIAFHAAMGYVESGRMAQVARKFGHWQDLVLMQKTLNTPK